MEPSEFLTFARHCVTSGHGQAGFRSATSRAYYAAFHHAKAFLKSKGVELPKEHAHDQVIQNFFKFRDDRLRNCGVDFEHLRSLRRRADYDLFWSESEMESDAVSILDDADAFIKSLRRYSRLS